MNNKDLLELLSLGENQTIEFKAIYKNTDLIGKTICAFLNSGGGYLIIGVSDQGYINGLRNDFEINELETSIVKKLSPQALISFESQNIEGKDIWIIEVPMGADIPYAYDNNVFIRVNENTVQATIDTIRDMIMRRQIEPERWERRFSDADISNDLDDGMVRATIRSDKHDKILTHSRGDTPIEMLEYLGFIKYGRLTCGGDVLFTKNPTKRFPQARAKAVCYKYTKIDNDYIDLQTFDGTIVNNIENIFAFIKRNIPQQAKFNSNNLTREEKPLYPLEAVREGLVNAFAHRDYADFKGSVLVQIFSDRIEIWNSGDFPNGITSETISKGQISILRNPDIAHVLYTRGFMEKLGRGGVLIRKACENYGIKEPKWTNDSNGVSLTFFSNMEITMEESMDVTMEESMDVTMEVKSLLKLLEFGEEYTRRELKEKMNLKNDDHFRKSYILPLLDNKLLEMTIPNKPQSSKQRYRLTKKGREYKERFLYPS